MPLQAGAKLGPYEIVALIAAGGMGEVYRAVDPRLDREVAIKIVRGALDQETVERFEREARAIAALSHPNILAIFDLGRESGAPFLVTELLAGNTLRARLGSGRIAAGEAIAIARQIAEALIAAHDKGIVHRDLKPENVFILPGGLVKLLDFGLARRIATPVADEAATALITSAGVFMGTVGYMAPEQTRGLECDGRVDLFALGAMLYEMLSGTRPFVGETTVDVISAILNADPRPFPPDAAVPSALSGIVRRLLAKDPSNRFQSARDLVAALDGKIYSSSASPAIGSTQKEPSLAVLPFTDLSPNRDHDYFCEGMAEEIISGLAKVSGLRVAASSASFRFRGRQADLGQVGEILHVDFVLEGSVRAAGHRLRVAVRLSNVDGSHIVWSKQFDRDLSDVFAVQDEIARTVVAALQVKLGSTITSRLVGAPTESPEAYALYLRGRFHWNKRTEPGLVEAIECFEQALALDPNFARAAAGLADVYATLGIYSYRSPDEVMPKAKTAALGALRLNDSLSDAHATLGTVHALYDWSWPESEQEFRRAVALDPTYATGLQWYAMHCLAPLGRFEEAMEMLTKALTLDPVSLPINVSVGFLHYLAGRPAEAISVLDRSLALDSSFMVAHLFMSQALGHLGDHGHALVHAEAAARLAHNSPETIGTVGFASARTGDTARAIDALGQLDRLAASQYVSPMFAAQIFMGLNDALAALDCLEDAYRERAADLVWLAVRPVFRPLHTHSRFQSLLQQLGLSRPDSESKRVARG